MRWGYLLVLAVLALVLLSACAGRPGVEKCKSVIDCDEKPRDVFRAQCVDGQCVYSPIPGVCGNGVCDGEETECSCSEDCGSCSGSYKGSAVLKNKCFDSLCLPDASSELVYSSHDLRIAGDSFKVDVEYPDPFNLKKDVFGLSVSLSSQGKNTRDERITGVEVSAFSGARPVALAGASYDAPLWLGKMFKDNLRFSFPTSDVEGILKGLNVKINLDYSVVSGSSRNSRSSVLQVRLPGSVKFVNPPVDHYPCPDCDDDNPFTNDFCGPETGWICAHSPVPGVCGNDVCDAGENRCSCPEDCGSCSGSAGRFVDFACRDGDCVSVLKQGVVPEQKSIFDDRRLGPVHLNNNFVYSDPWSVGSDVLNVKFEIYELDPSVESFTVERIRLLDGQNLLGEKDVNLGVSSTPLSVEVPVGDIGVPEEQHSILAKIWYSYVQNGRETRSQFSKSLGRITLVSTA